MKPERLLRIVATTLLAATQISLGAQEQKAKHHHYKLVDMGTLGGPQSVVYEQGTRSLNNHGTFTGCADTPTLDPNNPQNPYFLYPDFTLDPYIQHVFEWQEGEVTNLGALSGGTSGCTQWINEQGWIVGGSTNGAIDPLTGYPEVNAALWKSGSILNLGTLGGNQSLAWSVNDNGQVVGFGLNDIADPFAVGVFAFGATQAHAVLWQNGAARDLGTLGGPDSDALMVNASGQIAGMSMTNFTVNGTTGQPTTDPFLWENGKMIDIGTLGGTFGYPNVLNSRGQIVGASDVAGDVAEHPFLWERGVLTDLGTLGGSSGEARWINDAGEVAGWANLAGDQEEHAFLWKKGVLTDLGALPGSPCSYANGINASGQVVGAVQQCPNQAPRRAFLWENGDMVDLNFLIPPNSGVTLINASQSNDRGEVVAEIELANGDTHAAMLVPDGDCDDNCEERIAVGKDAAASAQLSPESNFAHEKGNTNRNGPGR